jgi:hypothetical protein
MLVLDLLTMILAQLLDLLGEITPRQQPLNLAIFLPPDQQMGQKNISQ